jgi:hypothetical protein
MAGARAVIAFIALIAIASADPTALLRARKHIAAGITPESLDAAVAELAKGEKKCGSSDDGVATKTILSNVKAGYENLSELLKEPPADISKLEKKLAAATKKQTKAQAESDELADEELVSKAEKDARADKLAKATAAVDAAQSAISKARAAASVQEAREPSLFPRLSAITKRLPASAKVQVISEAPAVVVVDDWLGEATLKALAMLPEVFANNSAGEGSPTANATDLGGPSEYSDSREAPKPSLCLPVEEGATSPSYLKKVAELVNAAKKAKASGKPHCDATAGLVEEAPSDWDKEEDGEWSGEFNTPGDRYKVGGKTSCGPLTVALSEALTQAESMYFTISTELAVDILDFAVSGALGYFPLDAEPMASAAFDMLVTRADPSAIAPDDWDEEEDGPWQPPEIEGKDATAILQSFVTANDGNSSALGDAYAFSSSPELKLYHASLNGREALSHPCPDFLDFSGRNEDVPQGTPSLLAFVHASEPSTKKGSGGDLLVPAAGVSVAPKKGRLILVESSLDDGSCDPAAAFSMSPLSPKANDLLVLKKIYYTDKTFSREQNNHEGPQKLTARVFCLPGSSPTTGAGCVRYGHVGAQSGDAVLPLREAKTQRPCMGPGYEGACFDANYVEPEPAPKKKKKPKAAPASAEKVPPPPGPGPPEAPGAPPPVSR